MERRKRAITITGISNIDEVQPGDDLARLIVERAGQEDVKLADGSILVVAQKVVSKAEGRLADLRQVTPSALAVSFAEQYDKDARFVEVVLQQSKRIVKMDHGVLIVETHHGFVCANAGVDGSNVPGKHIVSLLPVDPDASAERLRKQIEEYSGCKCAVIISDTFGRPWREGLTNVAIGVSGMEPLLDYRNTVDEHGFTLHASVLAVADEIAAAAELIMGKLNRIPVVVVEGYSYCAAPGSARKLVRSPERDLFR